MKSKSINMLIIFSATILLLSGFNLVRHSNSFSKGNGFMINRITPEDIIKTFDFFFSLKGTKKNYSSCTFIKNEVNSLHELFVEKYPRLENTEVSYDMCIKTNEDKYFYFDYSHCRLIEKKEVPTHIVHVFDKTMACMGAKYWNNTKRTRLKNRTGKIYQRLDYSIYIEVWYN